MFVRWSPTVGAVVAVTATVKVVVVVENVAISVPPQTAAIESPDGRRKPVFGSAENEIPGSVCVPEMARNCPIIPVWPSRGRESVSISAMSLKFSLT